MRALFSRVGEFNARIEENVGGIRVVQAFANEDHERQLFASDNARYPRHEAGRLPADGHQHVAQLYTHADRRSSFVMIAGAYFVLRGELTVGGFVGFLLLVERLLPAGGEDQRGAGDLPEGHRRVQALLRAARHRAGHRRRAGRRSTVEQLRGEIRFESVTLRLRDRTRRSWTDIDLDHPRRARRSRSSGRAARARRRSARLLPRFYEVDAGRITIDGIDIRADDAGLAAAQDRHRAAGCLPVRRHDPREHRLRPAGRDARTRSARRPAARSSTR